MSAVATHEQGRLCVFARVPELGAVKTRLAQGIGAERALRAHEQLVRGCLQQLADLQQLRVELWVAGPVDHPGAVAWSAEWGLPLRSQRGAELGARMADAMEQSLASAPFAIIVGTDCPTLSSDYVRQAVRELAQHDLVLGPAEDGGYGLIGLRRPVAELFTEMPWGSKAVTAETLTRARQQQLDVQLLSTLWDVDTEADWQRFVALASSGA